MVEHKTLRGLDLVVVNHRTSGDISHATSNRSRFNDSAAMRRNNAQSISAMDYVTEWNILNEERKENQS